MSDDMSAPKSRGLGRGLNALFEDEEDDLVTPIATFNDEVLPARPKSAIGIAHLRAGVGQPRRLFKEESLRELADSIAQHGILQPLLVRAIDGEDGEYEIIAGERRWRAAQMAQLHEVPVIVLDISEVKAFEIALIENLQREDLDPIDEAMGFERLMEEHDYSQAKLAESLGKSRSYIANITRLLQLPTMVKAYLSAGEISIGHARALITADDSEALAREVMDKGLSVRDTEKLVAEMSGGARTHEGSENAPKAKSGSGFSSAAPSKDPDIIAVEAELTSALGMRVEIDSSDGKSGTVSISFGSLDQMDDLMKRLLGRGDHLGGRLQE